MKFTDLPKKDQQRFARLRHVPGIAEAIAAMIRRHAAMRRNYVKALVQAVHDAETAQHAKRAKTAKNPKKMARAQPRHQPARRAVPVRGEASRSTPPGSAPSPGPRSAAAKRRNP
jgi:hypothetical protein